MRAALLLLPVALAATELNCGAPSTAYDMTNSTSLGSLLDLRDAFCGALLRHSGHSGPMNWTDVTADGGVWRGWRASYTLGGEVRRGGSGAGKWRHGMGGMGHGMGHGMGRRPGRGPGRGGRGRKGLWRDDDDDDDDDDEDGDDEDDDETGGDPEKDDDDEDGDDVDGDDEDGDDGDDDDGEDENAETLKLGRRSESTKTESTSKAESTSKTESTSTAESSQAESSTKADSTTKAETSTNTTKTGTTTKPTKTDTKAEKTSSSKASTSPTSSSSSKSSPTDKHKPVKVMFIADQENADASACRRAFLEIVQGCMLGAVKPNAKNAGSAVWKEGNDRYGISFSQ